MRDMYRLKVRPKAKMENVAPRKSYIGHVEAVKSVSLRPQITGYVEKTHTCSAYQNRKTGQPNRQKLKLKRSPSCRMISKFFRYFIILYCFTNQHSRIIQQQSCNICR